MTYTCGWKDDEGNVLDIREIEALSPFGAKYNYIREHLFVKYPELKRYSASSLTSYIYAGTAERLQKKLQKK